MITYTLYDQHTGRITGVGMGDKVPPHALEGVFEGARYYVQHGQAVPFPERPGEHYVWDWSARGWRLDNERVSSVVRAERDRRLAKTDWTQLPDVPLATKEAWAAYRQALRDVTGQSGFPQNVEWPREPAR